MDHILEQALQPLFLLSVREGWSLILYRQVFAINHALLWDCKAIVARGQFAGKGASLRAEVKDKES